MQHRIKLKRTSRIPPEGWWCQCPVIGKKVVSPTFQGLIESCAEAIAEAGEPIPLDLPALVEEAICKRVNNCDEWCENGPVQGEINISTVKRFMTAVILWIGRGAKNVDTEEAERRASICANCPAQVDVPGCFMCRGIGWMVKITQLGKATSHDDKLKTCGVCGCYNATQVHWPIDVLHRISGDLNYEEKNPECWKIQKSPEQ